MAMIDSIRHALAARPFRPFTLHMVDGTEYTVEHADFLTSPGVSRPREVYFYTLESGDRTRDDYTTHWINLSLVQAVIFPNGQEARRPGGGGN
jgi:hypothetical protein